MFFKNLELRYPPFGHIMYFFRDFWPYLFVIIAAFALLILGSYKIHKKPIDEKKKKIIVTVLFTLFVSVLIYSFFEAYFRYRYNAPDGLGFLKVSNKWKDRHVVLNDDFFRDKKFDANKKEGTTRIGVLGDSVTFGGGIENVENRFSNLLEKKLKESGKNVEVYNLGRPGYDTSTEIPVYQAAKQYKFDILVWEYFINDVQPGDKSTGAAIINKYGKKDKIVTFFSNHSYFFDYMYWRLSSKYQKAFQEIRTADVSQYKNEAVLNHHKEDIKNLMEEIKSQNTKVVVIIFPSNILLGPNYPKFIPEMMSAYFREQGAIVYDLLPDLIDKDPKTLVASKFDPHPNEIVHAIAADRLFEIINPLLEK